jgi:hypothetical protein
MKACTSLHLSGAGQLTQRASTWHSSSSSGHPHVHKIQGAAQMLAKMLQQQNSSRRQ